VSPAEAIRTLDLAGDFHLQVGSANRLPKIGVQLVIDVSALRAMFLLLLWVLLFFCVRERFRLGTPWSTCFYPWPLFSGLFRNLLALQSLRRFHRFD
jgi:hypothetical protein